ncbi:MAG: amidohydrolase, partial [Chryseobacterium artocarpi]
MKRLLYILTLPAIISSCQNKIPKEKAEILYFGGPIITMENTPSQVEAVAVKDGKILFAGTKSDAERYSEPSTKMINLNGKTLLPGFIDVHGHLT